MGRNRALVMDRGSAERHSLRRAAGWALLAVLATSLVACGGDARAEHDALSHGAGGDVVLPSGPALAHTVTSDDYRRWLAAEAALQGIGRTGIARTIPLTTSSDDEVEEVAERIESDTTARAAIEDAGLSVEQYVRTTVALEQALTVSSPEESLRFRDLPAENVVVVDRHRNEIRRARARSAATAWDDDEGDDRKRKKRKKDNDKGKDRD